MSKKIIDERCRCGHLKSEHGTTMVAVGHGSCNECGCCRFTWMEYIYG